jgi:preprotein translocase subunit YajC
MLFMFTSSAFAQEILNTAAPAGSGAGPGAGSAGLLSFAPMILILVVFYFLLIRPQQKKVKEHQTMVNALRRGDKIVTAGGIIGKIAKVDEAELIVEIADNVQIKVLRSAVQTVLTKPEPRDEKDTKTVA